MDHAAPITVAALSTLALLALGIATGQLNWPINASAMVLGGAGVWVLDRRVGLSRSTMWGLMVFGVSHLAGGMIPVGDGTLYQWWLIEGVVRYDNLQHAWGFGFAGRATWEALRHRLSPRPDDVPGIAFTVVAFGAATIGACNEILEYVLTLTLADTNVGGYDNTVRDLVANLVGGMLVGGWTRHTLRRG